MTVPSTQSTIAQTLLRLAVGGLMLGHGLGRFTELDRLATVHGGEFASFSAVAIAGIETAGAIAIVLGWLVRPAAGLLGGIALLSIGHALIVQHFGGTGWEASSLYAACFLWLAIQGGGPWSLDNLLGSRDRGAGSGVIAKERLATAVRANAPTHDPTGDPADGPAGDPADGP